MENKSFFHSLLQYWKKIKSGISCFMQFLLHSASECLDEIKSSVNYSIQFLFYTPHPRLNQFMLIFKRPDRKNHIVLWVILLFLFIAFIWSYFSILEEVTSAQGKVIPSKKVQIIQNLEGGIINKIFVKEGEVVEKNQPLLKMDETQFLSDYREKKLKKLFLKAKIARLTAEIEGKSFVVSDELNKEIPEQVKSENAQYVSRKNELNTMNEKRALITQELNMTKPLVKSGAVSQVDVLHLEAALNELSGKMDNFRSSALNELNQAKSELASTEESEHALHDRLERTTVRSPMKGVVKQIFINTEGGVVKPGMDIIEVVPLEDTLLIEAQVKPSDIGFLHQGQQALVKITAYEYSVYGGLTGTLEHISADTTTNEKDESFYKVLVRTKQNYLGSKQQPLLIIPGMTATVDIITGEKSMLTYILKPIINAKQQALRER